tara:strand:- start:543 stop:1727 length:1185 start_codon:yes stop_codon:yes gene_type:complete
MGFYRGANIIRDGLVFGYDTGVPMISSSFDFYRFNAGEPTTNEADTNTKRTLQMHATSAGNAGTIADASSEKGPGWKKITITTQGTNHRLAQFPYIGQDNKTKTYSIEYDFNGLSHSTGSGTSGYYWKLDGSNGNMGTNVKDTGKKKSMTYTNSSSQVMAIFLAHTSLNRANLSDKIYFKNYQVEEKSHNTPFVETTRSISGSLIDIIGSKDIKLTAASFDNEGQLSFDGTNDYLEVPDDNSLDLTTNMSFEFVVKAESSQSNPFPRLIDKSNYLVHITQTSPFTIAMNITISGGTLRQTAIGSAFTANKYAHIVCTYDGRFGKIYVNGFGLFERDFTTVAGAATNSTSLKFGGNGTTSRVLNGEIPVARVYNRELSADEILQNFNSLKNRFNI